MGCGLGLLVGGSQRGEQILKQSRLKVARQTCIQCCKSVLYVVCLVMT